MSFIIGSDVSNVRNVDILVAPVDMYIDNGSSSAIEGQITFIRSNISLNSSPSSSSSSCSSPVHVILRIPCSAVHILQFNISSVFDIVTSSFPSTRKKSLHADVSDEESGEEDNTLHSSTANVRNSIKSSTCKSSSSVENISDWDMQIVNDINSYNKLTELPSHILHFLRSSSSTLLIARCIPNSSLSSDIPILFSVCYTNPLISHSSSHRHPRHHLALPSSSSPPSPRNEKCLFIPALAHSFNNYIYLSSQSKPSNAAQISDDDDDDPSSVFFDHTIYSIFSTRSAGGKSCDEMLLNMRERFASGSFAVIVNPTKTQAGALKELHSLLHTSQCNVHIKPRHFHTFRQKRIVTKHPHTDIYLSMRKRIPQGMVSRSITRDNFKIHGNTTPRNIEQDHSNVSSDELVSFTTSSIVDDSWSGRIIHSAKTMFKKST